MILSINYIIEIYIRYVYLLNTRSIGQFFFFLVNYNASILIFIKLMRKIFTLVSCMIEILYVSRESFLRQ